MLHHSLLNLYFGLAGPMRGKSAADPLEKAKLGVEIVSRGSEFSERSGVANSVCRKPLVYNGLRKLLAFRTLLF